MFFERPSTDGTNGSPSEYLTILYVEDVARTLAFYEQAFGLKRKRLCESGDFAELDTGSTTLTFVSRTAMAQFGIHPSPPKLGAPCFEVALETDEVAAALERAVQAGARLVQDVEEMPWGQTTAYVADPDGFLVEICSPITST
ncbi:MAG: VOC family protein [Proteobacteria bacterium]|nr:VOC family protein [Pseudomonadota bacterium]MCL2307665.1 VOC family protein [Pseudomonadota bacterium]